MDLCVCEDDDGVCVVTEKEVLRTDLPDKLLRCNFSSENKFHSEFNVQDLFWHFACYFAFNSIVYGQQIEMMCHKRFQWKLNWRLQLSGIQY